MHLGSDEWWLSFVSLFFFYVVKKCWLSISCVQLRLKVWGFFCTVSVFWTEEMCLQLEKIVVTFLREGKRSKVTTLPAASSQLVWVVPMATVPHFLFAFFDSEVEKFWQLLLRVTDVGSSLSIAPSSCRNSEFLPLKTSPVKGHQN